VDDLEVSSKSGDLRQRRQAQPPIEIDGIQVIAPAHVAAGLKSVLKAAEVTIKEPGLLRAFRALFHLNQFDGIDCPGCAWPDSDHERSLNEYCENGVKAIAEEATAKLLHAGVLP
jgi:hypothetical protein